MKEKITHNLGLKILSVVIAFLVWLIVVNVSNPEVTDSVNVPLEVLNGDVLANAGLSYKIENNRTSVTVAYTARTQDLSGISKADFRAYVDLADYYPATGTVPVYVEVLNNKEGRLSSVSARPSVLRVETEEIQQKDFDLAAHEVGTPAAGYEVDSIQLSPSMVTVEAPESVIGRISSVGVEINVEGLSSETSGVAAPVFYDANNNQMSLGDQVEINVSEISYTVSFVETKTVQLDFQVSGTPADGYRYTGLEASADTIQIMGPHEVISQIDRITVPGQVLNLDGAEGDQVYTVDVEDYLTDQENVSIPWDSQVTITLRVQQTEHRALEDSTDRIIRVGGQDDFHYTYDRDTIEVVVEGLSEDLEGLDASDLIMEMDVSQMGIGSYAGVLTFDGLDDGVEVTSYSDFHVLVSSREIGPGVSVTEESSQDESTAADESTSQVQESSTEQTESSSETAAP